MANKSTMLFDVLKNILVDKDFNVYEQHISSESFKDAAPFMIRRYLTMSPNKYVRQIVLDNYLSLERMPVNILYRWLIMNIPKQNNSFIQYIR